MKKRMKYQFFQEVLKLLNLKGKTVTADAMHCQRGTCEEILGKGADYVICLKWNQPSLYNDVAEYYENSSNREDIDRCETLGKNAGRIERRICWKMHDASWLLPRHNWLGLKTAFCVERIVDERGRKSQEMSYYISSNDDSPMELLQVVREHWKIESMHWMLDINFFEDACRFVSENAHKALNAIRKCALATHKNFLKLILIICTIFSATACVFCHSK